MRVRLMAESLPANLAEQFPALGTLLHPESNRQEWAIVLLDRTLSTTNSSFEMLLLRPPAYLDPPPPIFTSSVRRPSLVLPGKTRSTL
jgi:hypothetical protein